MKLTEGAVGFHLGKNTRGLERCAFSSDYQLHTEASLGRFFHYLLA